jgi:hypothetical protein
MRDTDYFSVNTTLRRCSTKTFLVHDLGVLGPSCSLVCCHFTLLVTTPLVAIQITAISFPQCNVNDRSNLSL